MKTNATPKVLLYFLFILLFSLSTYAQTPGWQWAKRVGSFNDNYLGALYSNEQFNDIKTDSIGNVYAVGDFFQNPAFNNQFMGFPITGGFGERDAYLFKFSKCGKTLWWRRWGGSGLDRAISLVFDGTGKVIVCGFCSPTFTLGGNNIQNTSMSTGGSYLARFDTAGNFIDIYSGPSPSYISAYGTGKVFITAQGDYFITDGLQASRINTLGVTTATYSYVTGVSQNWVKVKGITLDKFDNVYMSGFITNTAVIGGSFVTHTNVPLGKSIIYKFSPSGTLLWIQTSNPAGNNGDNLGNCTIDTSGTILATAGATRAGTLFGYPVNVPPSSPNFCGVANVFYFFSTSTGSLISAVTATPQCMDFISPYRTDKNNNIHCAGTMNGYYKFGTTTYSTNPVTTTRQNCIAKMDLSGNLLNFATVSQAGGGNGSVSEGINALDLDTQGNIYIAGMFSGTLDSLGTAVNIIGGYEDGFIAKYGYACACVASTATISPTTCNSYTSPSGNYIWSASGSYQDTLVNTKGCDSLIMVNLTINQNPMISVNSGAICKGQSFTITTGGAITYTYSDGSAVVSPVANTTYTVTGTNTQGCTGIALSTVTVNPLPQVGINGTVTLICEGESITLNATGAISYTWSTNDNGNAVNFSPTSSTTYSVRGTDANGCENSAVATQAVDPCTGINHLTNFDGDLKLYPNPGNGQFTIELPADALTVITDALGRVVYNKRLKAGVRSIVIKEATNGIYFVKITTVQKQFVRQIVIEK